MTRYHMPQAKPRRSMDDVMDFHICREKWKMFLY